MTIASRRLSRYVLVVVNVSIVTTGSIINRTQMVRDRDRVIAEMGEKMKKIKDDFHYNLQLIEERDAELERWDGVRGIS
jgi:hypothetical protein